MFESLESIDRDLFLYINGWNHEFMDPLMYLVSNKLFWIPLYVFLLYMVYHKYGWKGLGYFAMGIALVILVCDQMSSTVIKPLVARYRPCNNLEIMDLVHKVNDRCGSGFSFVSGHATNFFGISVFTYRALNDKRFLIPLFIWAAVVAYSRVYLGVHYPSDVTAGALLGIFLGSVVYILYARVSPLESEE
ncbi:MAG: phosphatase PAP2 family protein [Flavobacteriales bacterium]|nr:phosphatase PAP2 family protein [Flavobacteriales bacterium]